MKRAIVSVINDLSTDQRVHKVCTTLTNMGYDVLLIGRSKRSSQPLTARAYKTKRMFLLFEKGPLFYITYQKFLFWNLIFRKADILVSNDLDTLLPNYLVSKVKRVKLVYDTHELFCEVPELIHNPIRRKLWKRLERWIFPKLKYVFTVNDSISKIYSDEYNVKVNVVRNVPFLSVQNNIANLTKADINIPENQKVLILQGAGINIDRGAEELVEAMQYIKNAILLIIGSGDVINILKQKTNDLNLQERIKFIGKVPFEKLVQYTRLGDLGLTLDKDTNINYRFSLPNKLFDYIHAGVPVLSSNLIEIKNIILKYNIGDIVENHNPVTIADKISSILADNNTLDKWKMNTATAVQELNWETEEKILKGIYSLFL